MKEQPESNEKRAKNRDLIIRALTDPGFREMLNDQLLNEKLGALGLKEISELNQTELRFIQAAVSGIECQVGALADQLLCANGGPCGIAAATRG